MSIKLTAEQRIQLIRHCMLKFGDYDPNLKHLLTNARKLNIAIMHKTVVCDDACFCIKELEQLTVQLGDKLTRQRNFKMVIGQVTFD